MYSKRIPCIAAILLLSIGLIGCERTKIADITADPGSFRNKEVQIAGEVTQSMGASIGATSKGVYQISDGTGTIWVYSDERGVPSKGAHVGVKGRVAESVTILGKNYGTLLRESNRHTEKATR